MLTLPGSFEHNLKDLEAEVGEVYNTFTVTKAPIPNMVWARLCSQLEMAQASYRRPSRDANYLFKSISVMLSDLEDRQAIAFYQA